MFITFVGSKWACMLVVAILLDLLLVFDGELSIMAKLSNCLVLACYFAVAVACFRNHRKANVHRSIMAFVNNFGDVSVRVAIRMWLPVIAYAIICVTTSCDGPLTIVYAFVLGLLYSWRVYLRVKGDTVA